MEMSDMFSLLALLFQIVTFFASLIVFVYSLDLVNKIQLRGEKRKDPTYVLYSVGVFMTSVGLVGTMFSILSSAFVYDGFSYITLASGISLTLLCGHHLFDELPKVHEQMLNRLHI
jgi:hypothetical protein